MKRCCLIGASAVVAVTLAGLGRGWIGGGDPPTPAPEAPVVEATPVPASADLVELHRRGGWDQVAQVVRARGGPAALSPDDALVAADAARRSGDLRLAADCLASAASGDLAQVASVELAELLLVPEPSRAAALAAEVLGGPGSRGLRQAAVEALARAIERDQGSVSGERLARLQATLPRPLARRLELPLALHDPRQGRRRLVRLLTEADDDLVACCAAQALAGQGDLTSRETWRVGRALVQQGYYNQALAVLESFDPVAAPTLRAEVDFLRGRACFRAGRGDDAAAWFAAAAAAAGGGEEKAGFEIHRSRALELAGRRGEAVEAARHAIALAASDERRLHLARLRLRQGEAELAAEGVARLASSGARSEGALILAVRDLAEGRVAQAEVRLTEVRQPPFAAAAAVLEAGLAAGREGWGEVVAVLDRPGRRLGGFWAGRARLRMAAVPEGELSAWRGRLRADLASGSSAQRLAVLRRWASLEPDPAALEEIRRAVAEVVAVAPVERPAPQLGSPLARRLFALDLGQQAVRFAADDLPGGSVADDVWTARALAQLGRPWQAIRVAERAARRQAPGVEPRALPGQLREVLYPLPEPDLVRDAAARAGVPAALLAGLVREESRWRWDALSPVGARGLTQMMPATAAAVAASLGDPPPSADALLDPGVSLRLGAAELGRLLERFAGQQVAAIAAYNAGEAQTLLWLEQCGPRCDDERLAAVIGFAATRDYVAEVLASAAAYQERLEPAPTADTEPVTAASG